MKEISCCFSGHRQIPKRFCPILKLLLFIQIRKIIKQGIKIFYTGGALGFDTLAAEAVLMAKKKHKDIKLIIVCPCKNQTKYWTAPNINKYNNIKSSADDFICLAEQYTPGCMHKRNRYLVDNSSYCICFLSKTEGGTAYTVDYARKKGLNIINLASKLLYFSKKTEW